MIDLSGAAYNDTIYIEGKLFTAASITDVANGKFLGAAGLQANLEDDTYGVSGINVEVTPTQVILRSDPPGDTLSITVNGGITKTPVDLKVSLLKQYVLVSQGQYVVLSDNPIDLFSPATGQGQHVGWYFDLPGNSERLINDVIIRGGILYAVPTIPSESPCEAGGTSIIYALDACNGGRTFNPAANPIWVAPSGLRRSGLLYSPAILTIPGSGTDVLHFSTSGGKLESEIAITEKVGFLYWRTW